MRVGVRVGVVRLRVAAFWARSCLRGYRTIKDSVFFRFSACLALFAGLAFPQSSVPSTLAENSVPTVAPIRPDMEDPMVVRAQENLDRVRQLVAGGALPLLRMHKAQLDVQDAMDMSMLKQSMLSPGLLPEQADQLVAVAQRMALRRQQNLVEMQQRLAAGVVSAHEAEATEADFQRARTELVLAQSLAFMVQQLAEAVRIEKGMASLETEVEAHPEWNGKVYTKFDGSGVFTPADMRKISGAFLARFARALPISADGATAVHRSMGFDHRGRVDIALNPSQTEGVWLIGFLQKNRIPYFAFRSAVPHMATGAHIHIGLQSTRFEYSE